MDYRSHVYTVWTVCTARTRRNNHVFTLCNNDDESEIRAPRTLALLPLALTLFHLSSLTYYHQLKVYIAHSILQSHLVTIVFVVRCEGCDIPVLWLLFISSMAV